VVQRLIVGPWRHDQIWRDEAKVGDLDFGRDAVMGVEKAIELSGDWFEQHLSGKNPKTRDEKVKLFVMGVNEWRSYDAWPPKAVNFEKWHFDSAGGANSSSGDGVLAKAAPSGASADTFVFDPMAPVPTVGGANFHFFLDNLGIKDQREVERRDDLLVYTTSVLDKAMEIIGPLKVVLYASSQGKQTDFTAKLVEVRADGYARIIEDGIRRGPDPVSGSTVTEMKPGKVYKFTIDLGATGIVIPKGSRLRVDVSSSNFPKYSRNPNTGEMPERASKFINVRQMIHHTAEHPSHIVLPVLR
jgi:putative CocE/NonD family hydrolase